jgi:hypothetical protein
MKRFHHTRCWPTPIRVSGHFYALYYNYLRQLERKIFEETGKPLTLTWSGPELGLYFKGSELVPR